MYHKTKDSCFQFLLYDGRIDFFASVMRPSTKLTIPVTMFVVYSSFYQIWSVGIWSNVGTLDFAQTFLLSNLDFFPSKWN